MVIFWILYLQQMATVMVLLIQDFKQWSNLFPMMYHPCLCPPALKLGGTCTSSIKHDKTLWTWDPPLLGQAGKTFLEGEKKTQTLNSREQNNSVGSLHAKWGQQKEATSKTSKSQVRFAADMFNGKLIMESLRLQIFHYLFRSWGGDHFLLKTSGSNNPGHYSYPPSSEPPYNP